MILKNYKAVRDFDRDGVSVKSGQELVLSEREGEKRVAAHEVIEGRILDPKDPKDAQKIADAESQYDQKYESNMAKEKARDVEKQKELTEDDKKRADLVSEAKRLVESENVKMHPDEVDRLSSLETKDLEAEVKKMRDEAEKSNPTNATSLPPTSKKPAKGGNKK